MKENMLSVILWSANTLLALFAAPLLIGVVNKVKAFFAGRKGPRILQLYYDIAKLLSKNSVYSSSAGWIFRFAPWGALSSTVLMLLFLPAAGIVSPVAFAGDMILFVYLAGFGRMLTVLAAMETASAFEGMGASRECQFSMLAEGVIFTVLTALVMLTKNFTVSGCLTVLNPEGWLSGGTALLFLGVAFYIVMLCENCRVPVDDPETHLELTMIHEAMILDNSGPDLAAIHYAAALKLWVFLAFLAALLLPNLDMGIGWELLIFYGVILIFAISIGVVESIMARCRFLKVPQLLAAAFAMAVLAVVLVAIFGGRWIK